MNAIAGVQHTTRIEKAALTEQNITIAANRLDLHEAVDTAISSDHYACTPPRGLQIRKGGHLQVSALADLEPSRRGTRIVIGADCRIDSFVKIKPVGGNGDVLLGERCFLNSGCVLYSGNGIHIGDDVLIAAAISTSSPM